MSEVRYGTTSPTCPSNGELCPVIAYTVAAELYMANPSDGALGVLSGLEIGNRTEDIINMGTTTA